MKQASGILTTVFGTVFYLLLRDEWKKYPVIMCECTEFPEYHDINSKKHHTHLSKLEPIIYENKDKQYKKSNIP